MSETNPQGEAVQPSQKVRKPRVITGILIGLIVLAGGAFYYSSQVMDEDAPPTLEAVESGSKYQGLTTGGNHEFAMWEAEDLVEFNRIKAEAAIAGITPIDIDAGVNYLYAPAQIT